MTNPLLQSLAGHKITRSFLFLALSLCLCSALAANDEDPSRIWIERPWEYRYAIVIESPSEYDRLRRFMEKEIASGKRINFHRLEPLFPLSVSISTDPEEYRGHNKAIGAIVVQFDNDGQVLTPNDLALNLRGRMSRLFEIVLSAGDKPDSWNFDLGYWYTVLTLVEN